MSANNSNTCCLILCVVVLDSSCPAYVDMLVAVNTPITAMMVTSHSIAPRWEQHKSVHSQEGLPYSSFKQHKIWFYQRHPHMFEHVTAYAAYKSFLQHVNYAGVCVCSLAVVINE